MIIQRCSLNGEEGAGYQFRLVTNYRSEFVSYMNDSYRGRWETVDKMLSVGHKIITEDL